MYNFDAVYQDTTHWLPLYLGVIMQFSPAIVDFCLFHGPFTQVTVKTHGRLVNFFRTTDRDVGC